MPLKGVLLQRLLYADPLERSISDVDVLVPPTDFARVVHLLCGAGFRHRAISKSAGAVSLFTPEGMVLDLHSRLFGAGRYFMPTDEVFRRGVPDADLFGVDVSLMDQYDLYSHLIGKFASDHCDQRDAGRARDIRLVPSVLGFDPGAAAWHLVRCGMRRAARYALPVVVELGDDQFAVEVLRRLPPDPVGALLVAGARRVIESVPPRSPLGAIPAHLLNDSLPRAGYAMAAAAVNRVRYRLRQSGS